jgi:glycerol-3-phosphate acyltransferase PlsY
MLELGTKFLLSYLLGSIMGSMVMGRLKGGVDIRDMGSGNAGGTNALRTQGPLFALGVVVIDIGKGALGAGVVPGLEIPFAPTDPSVSREWLAVCCAAAAVMGHVWPLYHAFRGGKGAATVVGTLSVLAPVLLVPLLLVFAIVLVLSGFVGLSTMSGAVAMPVFVLVTRGIEDVPLLVYAAFVAAFIVYCHRSNIERMRAGNENRLTRIMLFKRSAQPGNDGGG